ncbi:MAG: hypothetical protein QXG00_07395 [Candidatus Woesearchaeota archaeon]
MKYKAPEIDNKPYYVPIVVKDKSYLIGYIHAMKLFTSIFEECMRRNGIEINFTNFEFYLDSTRFNDILMNGKRISELSIEEMQQFIKNKFEENIAKINEKHPDNNIQTSKEYLLQIECPCGLGFYNFSRIEQIPETSIKCSNCGRVILDYTGHYDTEFDEYDGKDFKNEN